MSSDNTPQSELVFPPGFMWGTATAAFQIEGGASSRSSSIWDDYCNVSGNVVDGDNGTTACAHYDKFKSDIIDLLVPLGARHYRFSISWPRIQSFGASATEDRVNESGVKFYNDLIDCLLENGIEPVVTLYHWDLPSAVAARHGGGWHSHPDDQGEALARAFASYAGICFDNFGDRVKYWITINEPFCCAVVAYEADEHAPGKIDPSQNGVHVYNAGHNLLLAHAYAVERFRKLELKQEEKERKIGITLNASWYDPSSDTDCDTAKQAAERAIEFEFGWFAHPIYFGDYPACMRQTVGSRLPKFTERQRALVKGSSDFLGINHYTTALVTGRARGFDEGEEAKVIEESGLHSYDNDKDVIVTSDKTWKRSHMGWPIVPSGLRRLVEYAQRVYDPTGGIIVTENGLAVDESTKEKALAEKETGEFRIEFYREYLKALHAAIHQGDGEIKANVIGYFLWSLMDNFEWAFGYTRRFGLYYVDYETLERSAKPAVKWYANVVKRNAVPLQ